VPVSSTTSWVRNIASTRRRKALLVGGLAAAVVAAGGTAYGVKTSQTDVVLSVDGKAKDISVHADTVGEVLETQGIEIGDRDAVAPSVDTKVEDGSAISVRYARQLSLQVDGKSQEHWVTATTVGGALAELGRDYDRAELSTSRGAYIGRDGMSLDVVTPKTVKVELAGKKAKKVSVTALTVGDALKDLGVELERRDKVSPASDKALKTGQRIVFTDFSAKNQKVARETIEAPVEEREDSSMYEGETEVVEEGASSARTARPSPERFSSRTSSRRPSRASSRSAPRRRRPRRPTSRAAAPSGTSSRSASPAATGRSTRATATTVACSSTCRPGRPTVARATRTRPAVRPRSRSRPRSATPTVATAPGRTARSSSVCRSKAVSAFGP
jgi:uncharacterized protein YabE (DUF348 family)